MKNTVRKPSTVKKVLSYTKRYIPLIIISLILALVTVACTLLIPIIVGEAIDAMVGAGRVDFETVTEMLVYIAAIAIVGALVQWLMSYINNKISYSVVKDIRKEAFDKIHALPTSYLDSHRHGDILSRIINDSEQFSEGLLMGFTQLFTGVVTIIATLVFMLWLNPVIALVVVVLTPVSLLLARFIASRSHNLFVKRSLATGEATSYTNEMLNNQKLSIAFSREKECVEGFAKVNDKLAKSSLGAIFYSSLVNPGTRFINNIIYAIVGLIGALLVLSAKLTVGSLSIFLSYAGQYAKPFNEISGVITEFQNSLACASRLFAFIEEIPESERESAEEIGEVRGDIRFENVSFSYTKDKPLLTNINLDIKAGQRIAIVGPTGCGKSTLINLLMRFYDVDEGRITLDGRDIRDITRESLRRSYGMVLQDSWLASTTVADNIRISNPEATDEQVIEAAKASHAHGFIKRLRNGYDTKIGEAGESLSAGEKQLLCIARLMPVSPPMLILDEATSSIDTRTELYIQDAFARLMKGRTSFIVAHRLSTIVGADRILVMKDGNIIESGTHEELLAADGFYHELYNSQFAGAVEDDY